MDTKLFSVLSQPNRLDIVELLNTNPRSVNEIAGLLRLNQPQTSKHLKILADAGVVAVTPLANKRIYKLTPQPFKELDTWLKKYRAMWEDRLDRLDELLRKEVTKNG